MKKILLFILLLAIIIVTSCAGERIIATRTVYLPQTQTITSVQTTTLQPTGGNAFTVTVTKTNRITTTVGDSQPSTGERPFSPITLTGSSDKKTAPFTVTTSEWIIDWSYVPDPELSEFAVFGFFVYPRGETVGYVESVLVPDSTSGTTYSYAGVGEYYISVTIANVRSWTITIRPA